MNYPVNPPTDRVAVFRLGSLTSLFALLAAVLVLAIFGTFLLAGIGQDPLQFVHSPQEYSAILLRNPPVLRLAIGLDNVFIVFYVSMFLTLGSLLWDRAGSRILLSASLGLLCVVGILDLFENMHFLAMISAAEKGLEIGLAQIELQVWESLVKFHVSYLGLFLLGFVLPRETALEKLLCFALRWVQLPIGVLIYLVPQQIAVPLVLARFSFFLLSLLAIAIVFRRRKFGSGEQA